MDSVVLVCDAQEKMSTNLCLHPIYHELFAKLSQIMQSETTVVNAKLQ